jgi:hypothetical protein
MSTLSKEVDHEMLGLIASFIALLALLTLLALAAYSGAFVALRFTTTDFLGVENCILVADLYSHALDDLVAVH